MMIVVVVVIVVIGVAVGLAGFLSGRPLMASSTTNSAGYGEFYCLAGRSSGS